MKTKTPQIQSLNGNSESVRPYADQNEMMKEYFTLFDLFAKRARIRRDILTCEGEPKQPPPAEENEKKEHANGKSEDPGAQDAIRDKTENKNGDKNKKRRETLAEDLRETADKILALESAICRRRGRSAKKMKSFPLMKIRRRYKLDETEFRVLLLLLRNEMITPRLGDRRYDRVVEILNMFFHDKFEGMRARKYFYPESRLCKSRLVLVCDREEAIGHRTISLPERVVREILGHRLPRGDEDETGRRRFFGFRERRRKELKKLPVPKLTLEQVVLPCRVKEEIVRCLSQIKNEKTIFKTWGFSDVLAYGRGVTMLFAGEPGTGKTMTAQAVANYLRKRLLVADMTQIIDCFVGETEKNISHLFREAKEMKAVLFFDEADGMFYKRVSTTQRAVDVAYNQAINVILQEIEKFEGVVILATNHSKGMDEALERRISLKVEFDVPDAKNRAKIWRTLIPESAPLSEDVDFDALAREFDFAGGHIKNAVLNAARFAVSRGEGTVITMQDLREAALGELKGKSLFGKKNNGKVGFRRAGAA